MSYFKQHQERSLWSKGATGYLEKLVTEIDEEDKKVLPVWRVKCIDLLNQKIKGILLDEYVKRLSYKKNT